MAEIKPEIQKNVGPKIRQRTSTSPDLVAPQVQFTPVRVIPSGLAEAASGISKGLQSLAGRGTGKEDHISAILLDTKRAAEKRLTDLQGQSGFTADVYNKEVRDPIYDDAISRGRAAKLDSDSMVALINQTKFLMNDIYPVDLVSTVTDPATAIQTTKMRGDVLRQDFDLEGVLAANMSVLMEQFPGKAQTLLSEAAGMTIGEDNVARPMGGSPDEVASRKRMATDQLLSTLADVARLENAQHEFSKLETSVNILEKSDKGKEVVATRQDSIMVTGYQSLASNKIATLILQDKGALLDAPPEQALAQLSELLRAQRGSVEFVQWESNRRDRSILDKADEQIMATAKLLFEGRNLKKMKEYSVEWQEATMSWLANDALLLQGSQAVALYKNAEKFNHMIGAAIAANAFTRTEGAVETPMGATIVGMMTNNHIGTLKGQLNHMGAERDPVRNTDNITTAVRMVRDSVSSLIDSSKNKGAGATITPFGALEQINEIKSNPAIARWLSSNKIPIADRRQLIAILNNYENTVQSVSGITQDELTKLTEKTWTPHPYFTDGIPEEEVVLAEIDTEE
jgi:hypothetical protein